MGSGGIIEYIIEDLLKGNSDLTFSETITNSASSYAFTTWLQVESVMKNAVFPIGAALLSIFMLIEIIGIIQRMDNAGQGMTGINIPVTIIIRWVIITFFFCRLKIVLLGIQSVMSTLAGNIQIEDAISTTVTTNDIITALSSMDMVSQIVCYIILMNIWFLFAALRILLSAFVIYRVFTIYIMTIFAPIPLSTLPNQEFRHTAFNYLKSYAAACMSGAVIMAAFKIYNLLVNFVLNTEVYEKFQSGATITAGVFCGAMLKMMIFFGILVSAVLNSGKLSKSLLNAT